MFPDKGYGFVDLPAMEAEKVKKKLNGSILKGTKMRVENAKPEKKLAGFGTVETETSRERKRKGDGTPKRKRKLDGTLEGLELPEGRKVKRGWTEPAVLGAKARSSGNDMKDKNTQPSQYTAKPECLFKTTI